MTRPDLETIMAAALGRWPSILADLGGLDPAILDGKHHPCPKCGGKDRFRLIDREAGALYCNGCLKDKTGDGLSALRWARGWDFPKTLTEVARFLGIQPGVNGRSKADKTIRPKDKDDSGGQEEVDQPADLFEQVGLSAAEKAILPALLKTWAAAKPPITPDAVAAYGPRFVRWPKKGHQLRCIAFAGRDGKGSDDPLGLLLYRVEGVPFPNVGSLGERKTHLVKRSRESWLWPGSYEDLLAAETIIKCEGATDMLALASIGLPPGWIAISNLCGCQSANPTKLDYGFVHGKRVIAAGDADNPGQEGARRFAAQFVAAGAAEVRNLRLPFDAAPDHGADLRDWIGQGHGADDFLALVEQSPIITPEQAAEWSTAGKGPGTGGPLIDAKELDPATEARRFLAASEIDGVPTVRFWRGTFLAWERGAYREASSSDVQSQVVHRLNTQFRKLNNRIIGDVMGQLRAQAALPSTIEPPTWLGEPPAFGDTGEPWPEDSVLVARNGLIHLPSLVERRNYFHSPTPRFFTTAALDYNFDVKAPAPRAWLVFLSQLWADDSESITTLQEWAGYCLAADTAQQKILALIGPRRSGKGTIGRVLRGLIGENNVAGPTFAGLASHFGLWGLLNKSLAIISDARLSGRTDQAAVVERLLTISGEDCLMVDRKCLPPVHAKLPTRLMILTNELPKLGDSSGALVGRLVLLQLRETFYGYEDTALTGRLLEELPGILLWAIEGWRRLQERGRFEQPRASLDMINELQDLASPIGAFVRERCAVEPGRRTSVDDLFAAWKEWCEAKGRREPGTVQSFARDLLAAVPTLRKVQPRDGRDRYRAYEGIGLLTNW